jgi:hypothetical protein
LCSGYAPVHIPKSVVENPEIGKSAFELYRGIPPGIAELTAAKLGEKLVRGSLDVDYREGST